MINLKYIAVSQFLSAILIYSGAASPVHVAYVSNPQEKAGELEWWQKTAVYQIYPRSYMDSDGDGIGDLKGITSKLDHIKSLGVETVWLSPINKSPMADFGYDISDFRDIDPIFGTMDDFVELSAACKEKGLRLLLDLVPGYTSDEHEWFIKSVQREDPYTDYFVWVDPKGFDDDGNPIPPSNWLSLFRFSAWKWNEERQQFFYHQFTDRQPDLNYYNFHVLQELIDIALFWLELGVDGFRCDAVGHLAEYPDYYTDEPLSGIPGIDDPTNYDYLEHIYTRNQPRTFEVLQALRKAVDDFAAASGETKVLFAEVYEDIPTTLMYYGTQDEPAAHLPFNFRFITSGTPLTGNLVRDFIVKPWLEALPDWTWTNWVVGNHDQGRVPNRFRPELIDAVSMMVQLLPGTSVTYYGEEIGMENTFITWEQTQDPWGCNFGPEAYMNVSRDPERTPMQWNTELNAGFSTGEPWLPVNPNHLEGINVADQEEDSASHLNIYRTLVGLRNTAAVQKGAAVFPDELANDESLVFFRMLDPAEEEESSYAVLINFTEEELTFDLTTVSFFPSTATVVTRSSTSSIGGTEPGSVVDASDVHVGAYEGLVLQF